MLQIVLKGAVGGMILAAGLAVFDAVTAQGHLLGMRTMIIGVAAGGMMLGIAFLMALGSYGLASRNRLPGLRRRMLQSAIFSGVAGMICGTLSAAFWFATGHVWMR